MYHGLFAFVIWIDAQKVSLVVKLKAVVYVRAVLSIVKCKYLLVLVVVVVLAVFEASMEIFLS